MRIDELDIDGFGLFAAQRVGGLGAGLNVFLGDNEAGKSTLLAYIRTMLFGFPDGRSRENTYPPLNGGSHGGRLLVVTEDGARHLIERSPGPRGGTVTVSGTDGLGGPERLRELLGTLTRDLFRNVYAFSLSELQSFETLQNDDVRAALYGASAGASILALPRVQKEIGRRLDDIFKPQGINPALNQRLAEYERVSRQLENAWGTLDRYNAIASRVVLIDLRLTALKGEIDAATSTLAQRRTILRIWPTWQDLLSAEQRLLDVPPPPVTFPEDGLARMQALTTRRDTLHERRISDREAVAHSEEAVQRIRVDERLLAAGEAIERLASRPASRPEHQKQIERIRAELADAGNRLAGTLAELGDGWDAERLRRIERSLFTRESIRKHESALGVAADRVKNVTAQLGALEQTRAKVARESADRLVELERLPDPGPGPTSEARALLARAKDDLHRLDSQIDDAKRRNDDERAGFERILKSLGPGWNEQRIRSIDLSSATQASLDELEGRIDGAEREVSEARRLLAAAEARAASERDAHAEAQRALERAPEPPSDPREVLDGRRERLAPLRRLLQRRLQTRSAIDGTRARVQEVRDRLTNGESECNAAKAAAEAAATRALAAERAHREAIEELDRLPAVPDRSRVDLERYAAKLRERRRLLEEFSRVEESHRQQRERLDDLDRGIAGLADVAPAAGSAWIAGIGAALAFLATGTLAMTLAIDHGLLHLPWELPAETRSIVLFSAPSLLLLGVGLIFFRYASTRRVAASHSLARPNRESLEAQRSSVAARASGLAAERQTLVAGLRAAGVEIEGKLRVADVDGEIDRTQNALALHAAHGTGVAAERAARIRLEDVRATLVPLDARAEEAARAIERLRQLLGDDAGHAGAAPPSISGAPAKPLHEELARLEAELAALDREIERVARDAGLKPPVTPEDVDAQEASLQAALSRLDRHSMLAAQVGAAERRLAEASAPLSDIRERAALADRERARTRGGWGERVAAMGFPREVGAKTLRSFLLPELRSAQEHLARLAGTELTRSDLRNERMTIERQIQPLLVQTVGKAAGELQAAVERQLEEWRRGDEARSERATALRRGEEAMKREREAKASLDEATATLNVARTAHADALGEWQGWLASNLLPADLSPDTALDALQRITTGIEASSRAERASQSLASLEAELSAADRECAAVLDAIAATSEGPLPSTIDRLMSRLIAARNDAAQRSQAEDALATARSGLTTSTQLVESVEAEIRRLLDQAGVEDEEEFRRRGRLVGERSALREEARQLERTLLQGTGAIDLGELRGQLSPLQRDDVAVEVERLEAEIAERETERDSLFGERAELVAEKARLASSSEIAELRARQEVLRAEIGTLAREWSRFAIAQHLLEEAKRRFERERQPRVLKDAGEYLTLMTAGRYPSVRATLDEGGELEVLTAEGSSVSPTVLSRGTQEQLYLALRFGYIANHQLNDETMPVVMDEVLVNFDPVRATRAAATIRRFAETRQILFFTCHPWVAQLLRGEDSRVPIWEVDKGSVARDAVVKSTPGALLPSSGDGPMGA